MNLSNLQGEELFAYLKANKTNLIQTKQASLKLCDAVISTVQMSPKESTKQADNKASDNTDPIEPDRDTLKVTIVANTANIVDSHMDMLTDGAYKESIALRGNTIPHILDHNQSAIGHVGDVTKVYTKKLNIKDLGYDAEGTTTALLMDSTVRKDYNTDVFKFYANGKINQHSIGMAYGDIKMAINSAEESYKEEKTVWDTYYPKVINKDIIDKRGYFWVIPKADIRENSAVLFGANSLTPTLSIKTANLSNKILSLGNEENVITPPIGNTMTLEEAQGKIISLTEELAKAKSDLALAKLEATTNEKNRVLNILKAQTTFGSDIKLQKAALSFIEKGLEVDTAITSFEVIKEAIQDASHVDMSGEGFGSSLTPGDVGMKSTFAATLDKAFDKASTSTNLFAGVK